MVWNLADGDGTLLVEMSVRALKVAKKDKIQEVREYDQTMGEFHT